MTDDVKELVGELRREADTLDSVMATAVRRDIADRYRRAASALEALSRDRAGEQKVVAWRRDTNCLGKRVSRPEFTDDSELADIWRDHPETDELTPLYASPAPDDNAGEQKVVAVRSLEWESATHWHKSADLYVIEDNGANWSDERYWLSIAGARVARVATLDAAKAAAQADYEKRILSALASLASPDDVRRMALEEGFDLGFASSGEGYNGEYPSGEMETIQYREMRGDAIRSLATTPENASDAADTVAPATLARDGAAALVHTALVAGISFLGRDIGTPRLEKTAVRLRNMFIDAEAALRASCEKEPKT